MRSAFFRQRWAPLEAGSTPVGMGRSMDHMARGRVLEGTLEGRVLGTALVHRVPAGTLEFAELGLAPNLSRLYI